MLTAIKSYLLIEKKVMIFRPKNKKLVIVFALLLVIGIVVLVMARGDEDTWVQDSNGTWVKHGNPAIQDFETCAAKYPVRETYPEQCAMPDGPTFTKQY